MSTNFLNTSRGLGHPNKILRAFLGQSLFSLGPWVSKGGNELSETRERAFRPASLRVEDPHPNGPPEPKSLSLFSFLLPDKPHSLRVAMPAEARFEVLGEILFEIEISYGKIWGKTLLPGKQSSGHFGAKSQGKFQRNFQKLRFKLLSFFGNFVQRGGDFLVVRNFAVLTSYWRSQLIDRIEDNASGPECTKWSQLSGTVLSRQLP